MELQSIIVGIIVLSASVYVGLILRQKTKSFWKSDKCVADCGCDSKSRKLT